MHFFFAGSHGAVPFGWPRRVKFRKGEADEQALIISYTNSTRLWNPIPNTEQENLLFPFRPGSKASGCSPLQVFWFLFLHSLSYAFSGMSTSSNSSVWSWNKQQQLDRESVRRHTDSSAGPFAVNKHTPIRQTSSSSSLRLSWSTINVIIISFAVGFSYTTPGQTNGIQYQFLRLLSLTHHQRNRYCCCSCSYWWLGWLTPEGLFSSHNILRSWQVSQLQHQYWYES